MNEWAENTELHEALSELRTLRDLATPLPKRKVWEIGGLIVDLANGVHPRLWIRLWWRGRCRLKLPATARITSGIDTEIACGTEPMKRRREIGADRIQLYRGKRLIIDEEYYIPPRIIEKEGTWSLTWTWKAEAPSSTPN